MGWACILTENNTCINIRRRVGGGWNLERSHLRGFKTDSLCNFKTVAQIRCEGGTSVEETPNCIEL